jgi:hypothetical protein
LGVLKNDESAFNYFKSEEKTCGIGLACVTSGSGRHKWGFLRYQKILGVAKVSQLRFGYLSS